MSKSSEAVEEHISDTLRIELRDYEYEIISKAARYSGVDVGEFIMATALHEAMKVLIKEVVSCKDIIYTEYGKIHKAAWQKN